LLLITLQWSIYLWSLDAAVLAAMSAVVQILLVDPLARLVRVEFNAPLDTVYVISEAVFTANHFIDTDKQNSTGKYR